MENLRWYIAGFYLIPKNVLEYFVNFFLKIKSGQKLRTQDFEEVGHLPFDLVKFDSPNYAASTPKLSFFC